MAKTRNRSMKTLSQVKETWARHYAHTLTPDEEGCLHLVIPDKGMHKDGYYSIPMGSYGSTPAYRVAWALAHDQHPLMIAKKNEDGRRLCLAHLCGDRSCCNPDHISLTTYWINHQHKDVHGTACNPALPGNAKKLTIVQKREIHAKWMKGATQLQLAAEYNVSQPSIHYIVRKWVDMGDSYAESPQPWLKK